MPEAAAMRTPCCDRMGLDLSSVCPTHQDRQDCADAFIAEVRGGYGLMVHDGGSSVIEIGFCPWCGTQLPSIGELDLCSEADLPHGC